jgi:hypothetical protein
MSCVFRSRSDTLLKEKSLSTGSVDQAAGLVMTVVSVNSKLTRCEESDVIKNRPISHVGPVRHEAVMTVVSVRSDYMNLVLLIMSVKPDQIDLGCQAIVKY